MARSGRTRQERGYQLERVKTSSGHFAGLSRPSARVLGAEVILPGVHRSRGRPLCKDRMCGRAVRDRGTLCLGAARVRPLRSSLDCCGHRRPGVGLQTGVILGEPDDPGSTLLVGRRPACAHLDGETTPNRSSPSLSRSGRMDKEKRLSVTRATTVCSFHDDRESNGDPRSQRCGTLPSCGNLQRQHQHCSGSRLVILSSLPNPEDQRGAVPDLAFRSHARQSSQHAELGRSQKQRSVESRHVSDMVRERSASVAQLGTAQYELRDHALQCEVALTSVMLHKVHHHCPATHSG